MAGIQRRVCEKCGQVTVVYLFDVFAEEQSQLEAATIGLKPDQA